jgi:rfaE bifunctional protein kinase chain/domain
MKKIFISGCFNVVHPGHVRLLRFGKESGDNLIVGISSDRISKGVAFVSEELRLENVKSISWVDECFVYDEPISNVILRLKPDIVIKGKEFESLHNIEAEVVKTYGGKLIFCSGEAMFSSSDLISRDLNYFAKKNLNLQHRYLSAHSISLDKLEEVIESFQKLTVLVIGDLIIDRYINCNAVGMSQEEPVLVVSPVDSAQFVGGAGIVAGHAASMGSEVYFLTVCGMDQEYSFALSNLIANSVHPEIFTDESRPTNLKTRYRSAGKSLLRVNRLHTNDLPIEVEEKLLVSFEKNIAKVDLVIFSDFNYGCLSKKTVSKMFAIIEKHKSKFISADSQSSSQVGDLKKFSNVDLISATEHEARLTTGDNTSGLVILARNLQEICNAKNVFLKLGADGLMVSEKIQDIVHTDILRPFNSMPTDVSGAGDSMLVASSMALCCGANVWEAGYIGSLASGIQVSRLGNVPIKGSELISQLRGLE